MRWLVILLVIMSFLLTDPIMKVFAAIWNLFGALADLIMPFFLEFWQSTPGELHPLWGLMCCSIGILVVLGMFVAHLLNRFRGWL